MSWRESLGVGERRWKKAPDEEVQPAKTLWDWLQLLIVPAILIGVTFAWSATQTRSDNKREDRRIAADRAAAEEARQDATLNGYLEQMSDLMLNKTLPSSKRERCGQVGRAHGHPHHTSPLGRRAKRRSRALPGRGRAHRRELARARRGRPPDVGSGERAGASRASTSRGADLTGRLPHGRRPPQAPTCRCADLTGADLTGAWPH